jgi:formyl transferase-like protein
MRTLLICHEGADLDREGLARWLESFSTYTGTVVIREPGGRVRRRIAREIARVGFLRFLDVLAFRVYYALARAAGDRAWEARALQRLRSRFPVAPAAPETIVSSPNSGEAEAFIREQRPDLVIARCKTLLAERVFAVPPLGTFVMHPGVCPEYRNAHGCFWAMAAGDYANVGMTLLRIDKGVDTGPVFGYFRVEAGEAESHVVAQHRVVLDHLDGVRDKLRDIEAGTATPIDTTGRRSATWGQPWLTAALRMRARRKFQVARHKAQDPSREAQVARHGADYSSREAQDQSREAQDTRHEASHGAQDSSHGAQDPRHWAQDSSREAQDPRHGAQGSSREAQDPRHLAQVGAASNRTPGFTPHTSDFQ